ncbi:hypothetical protein [Dolichospermum phage Dfl-JY45]
MSEQSALHAAGVRLLRLLNTHADVVVKAYTQRSLADEDIEPKVAETLMAARVLYRPEEGANLRLAGDVNKMFASTLRDDRNRQVDADVGGLLMESKTIAGHLLEAAHKGDFREAASHEEDLESRIWEFRSSLRSSIDGLWMRINAEFGYVATLTAKIRENALVQEQVSQLLSRLDMVDFKELEELANTQKALRRCLLGILPKVVDDCRSRLQSVQRRVNELMGKFRAVQKENFLLKGFLAYLDRNPSYVASFDEVAEVPELLNVADPMLGSAVADPLESTYYDQLLEEAAKIRSLEAASVQFPAEPAPAIVQTAPDAMEMALAQEAIEASIEAFLVGAIDAAGEERSAMNHLMAEGEWDAECWLHLLLLQVGQMDADPERSGVFAISLKDDTWPAAPGVCVVRDVLVRLAE